MLRSVVAVIVGFVVMGVLVIASTIIASILMLGTIPADPKLMKPTTGYIVVNLICSVLSAIFGGYLAARIARRSPLDHAMALAFLMALMTIPMFFEKDGPQPMYYKLALLILGPLAAILGGAIVAFTTRMAPEA